MEHANVSKPQLPKSRNELCITCLCFSLLCTYFCHEIQIGSNQQALHTLQKHTQVWNEDQGQIPQTCKRKIRLLWHLAIAVGRKNIHTVPFLHCKTTKIQPFIFSVVMHSSVPRSEMLLPINFLKGAACYTNRAEWSQPVRFAVVETQIHWGREVVGICLLSSVASLEDILDCPRSITVQLNYSCLYESLMACSGSNAFSFIKESGSISLSYLVCVWVCAFCISNAWFFYGFVTILLPLLTIFLFLMTFFFFCGISH